MNFDIANACLGFVNGMTLAANMIDSGQIKYAMIVNGEDAQATQETTLARLQRPETTREDFNREFATLTLGSGAAAAVLGPADEHPGAHRILGGVMRAGTEYHELCVGSIDGMATDTKGLLEGGLELVGRRLERGPAGLELGLDGPVRHPPGLQCLHQRHHQRH